MASHYFPPSYISPNMRATRDGKTMVSSERPSTPFAGATPSCTIPNTWNECYKVNDRSEIEDLPNGHRLQEMSSNFKQMGYANFACQVHYRDGKTFLSGICIRTGDRLRVLTCLHFANDDRGNLNPTLLSSALEQTDVRIAFGFLHDTRPFKSDWVAEARLLVFHPLADIAIFEVVPSSPSFLNLEFHTELAAAPTSLITESQVQPEEEIFALGYNGGVNDRSEWIQCADQTRETIKTRRGIDLPRFEGDPEAFLKSTYRSVSSGKTGEDVTDEDYCRKSSITAWYGLSGAPVFRLNPTQVSIVGIVRGGSEPEWNRISVFPDVVVRYMRGEEVEIHEWDKTSPPPDSSALFAGSIKQ